MAKDMCTNSDAIDSEHYCNIEQTECIDKTRIDLFRQLSQSRMLVAKTRASVVLSMPIR